MNQQSGTTSTSGISVESRWALAKRAKVAVVGGGISGLSAAYLLGARHEVHLFEAEGRLGGHANTVTAGKVAVDTGFIVFNELNYPHLTGLFRHLGVETCDSEMSLSVKFRRPDLEWGGTNLRTLVAQKRNLLRPQFWSMVADILRFNRDAVANLERARRLQWTLRDLLEDQRYGTSFIDWYLMPMGAAIWSTPTISMLDFPAETFLRFCLNHRLLQVNDRPIWKTVRGGSISYVRKIASRLENVHRGFAVESVTRRSGGIELRCRGVTHQFDAVVFATHPPETLRLLTDASAPEKEILGCFAFQKNMAYLHSDESFLPRRRSLWSSWNFQQDQEGRANAPVSLSYWMNRLQPLPTENQLIVSLNAENRPRTLHYEVAYDHPIFNRGAIEAQKRLSEIQGANAVFHCGAWTRYGFHEDGILSAVNVARAWNVPVPWETDARDAEPCPRAEVS